MPFFLLVPVWVVVVFGGLLLLLIPRARFLSSYVILGATGALFASFLLSTLVIVILPRLFGSGAGAIGAISVIGGYLGGIALGAVIGAAIGMFLAYRLNRILGRRY